MLGSIQDERLLQYITTGSRPAPRFYDDLDGSVGLLKLIPGTRRELLAFMADRYDGLVIEGFGVGGLPEYDGFYDVVRQAAESGKLVVMTTQVPNEGSDLTVYHVGGHLKHTLRVLEAYDMTTEAVVAKLMWIDRENQKGRNYQQSNQTSLYPGRRNIGFRGHFNFGGFQLCLQLLPLIAVQMYQRREPCGHIEQDSIDAAFL